MGSTAWNAGEAFRDMGLTIQHFLYVDGKSHKMEFQEHTIEEYQQLLHNLHERCWERHNGIMYELGWKQ